MQDVVTSSQIPSKKRLIPKSVPFIIGNEFAERFSFYGMRSIIAVFLVHQFFSAYPEVTANAKANAINHAFSTLVYFTPLLGAILADWFFGKYRVILFGSIIYTVGHFLLSVFDTSLSGFITGLVVIAFSAGAIKSCVSANVGDQFDNQNKHLMSSIYGWFYFSINAGSMISLLAIPLIYDKVGAAWAFGVPGILMALATLIFFSGRKLYRRVPPGGIRNDNFVMVNLYVLKNWISKKDPSKTAWQQATLKYGQEKTEAIRAVWGVVAVFAFIPIFWGMWDMNGSEWVLQSTKLNLNLGFFGLSILPSQIQFVNALFLLLMIPVFNYGIYPLVTKMGIKLTPLKKIGAGLFITGLSFIIIALLQTRIDAGGQPSVWWQIFAYFLLSAGEVLVSITGLEYAYTQSPPSMKSTMTAIWYFTYSVGTFFTTLVNVNIANKGFFSYFTGDKYFWLFVGIMMVFVLIFILVSPYIPEKSYLVDNEISTEPAHLGNDIINPRSNPMA